MAEKKEPLVFFAPDRESEDQQPVVANIVGVSGTPELLTVDFLFVHPDKLARVYSSNVAAMSYGQEDHNGDIRIPSKPVARVSLPMHAALELMVSIFERVGLGIPSIMQNFHDYSQRLSSASEVIQEVAEGMRVETAQRDDAKPESTAVPRDDTKPETTTPPDDDAKLGMATDLGDDAKSETDSPTE